MQTPTLTLAKTLNPRNLIVFFGDTDSIAFKKPDEKPFTEAEQTELLEELNSLLPEKIKFEMDGEYRRFIIIKRKNYLLDDGKKITIKGAALKATMKEPALQKFISEVLELLRMDKKDNIIILYQIYAREIMRLTSIDQWCFKKTITKSILNPERANESRVLDALKGTPVNEGDKVWLFFKTEEEYCLREKFDGTFCKKTLLRKLYDTLSIFETVIDVSLYPNYALKRNSALLQNA